MEQKKEETPVCGEDSDACNIHECKDFDACQAKSNYSKLSRAQMIYHLKRRDQQILDKDKENERLSEENRQFSEMIDAEHKLNEELLKELNALKS